MKDGQISLTATAVALAREVTSPRADSRALLPVPVGLFSSMWRPSVAAAPLRLAARVMSGGLVDHLRLRTAAIDAAVADAFAAGCTQLVLLGAGLDARAHRLPSLGPVTVWEVDHPATQAAKRKRARSVPSPARRVRYVAVDFAHQDLQTRLLNSGFDPEKPAVWVWEGVTMYLPGSATEATLDAIAQMSAPGSALAMTFMLPKVLAGAGPQSLALGFFTMLSEPLVGAMSSEVAAARVKHIGWRVVSDTGAAQWARQFGGSQWPSVLFHAERLLIAASP
ncbi:MAG: SAM-dependent methyltransferase [Myxococcales bacterium]|nr:SAM-dependent methyltransferase [Myxococcales bacterium]